MLRSKTLAATIAATLALSPAAIFVGCSNDTNDTANQVATEQSTQEATEGDTTVVTFKIDGDIPENTEIYLLAQRLSDDPVVIGHTVTPADLSARSVTFELPSQATYIIDVTSAVDEDGTIYVASTPNGLIETNYLASDAYIQLERHSFEEATQDEYYHLYYILQALLAATEGDVDMNNVVNVRTLALNFAQQKPDSDTVVENVEATEEAPMEENVDESVHETGGEIVDTTEEVAE